jgi:plastocyanin
MRSICRQLFAERRIAARALLVMGGALSVAMFAGESKPPATGEADRPKIVVIEGMKFSPATVHVNQGKPVRFENHDFVPHTVTAKDPKQFDSGMIKAGGSWTFTPKGSGTYHYHCTFHPTMEAEFVVE